MLPFIQSPDIYYLEISNSIRLIILWSYCCILARHALVGSSSTTKKFELLFSFLMVAFLICFLLVSILQVVLWPLLLKMLVVEKYTGAVSTVYFHSSSLKYSELIVCNFNLYLGVIFSPKFWYRDWGFVVVYISATVFTGLLISFELFTRAKTSNVTLVMLTRLL